MKLARNVSRSGRVTRRRAAVIAQVAASLTVLIGFMALSIDVGAMYNTKAELQRSADAAALAAAAELGDQTGDPLARARAAAQQMANLNTVLGHGVTLDSNTDFTFGTASISGNSSKYTFTPTNDKPNAIRVRIRRTSGSPSGAMPLFFARVFGKNDTNISAQATAVLTPRDICFVLDLSLSHSFDSQLMHYRLTEVGASMKKVWQYLNPSSDVTTLAATGPTFGNMRDWGTDTVDSNWNYSADTGLKQLKRGTAWTLTSAWVSQSLNDYRATQSATFKTQHPAAYTASELSVINSASGAGSETSTSNSTQKAAYRRRVLVALGIYRWESGKSGGQVGKNASNVVIGNGDSVIDAGEVFQIVPYPSSGTATSKQIGGTWDELVDYVADTSKADNITSNTGLSYRFLKYDTDNTCYGNPALRSRFGLKTMLDFVQQQHSSNSESPGLSGAPQQPMGAVADGVRTAIDYIKALNGNDQVGLAAYGQVGYGPSDYSSVMSWLSTDFDGVRAKIDKLQAAYWTGNTNISAGLDKASGGGSVGTGVLGDSATNSRKNASKIIFLLTDGNANVKRGGTSDTSPYTQAVADTVSAATDAATTQSYRKNPCIIYTISVGADADSALMQQVATIGKGQLFVAAGDTAAYQAQLQNIFVNLGGKRPVALIE